MPTTTLDGETYEQARHRRFTEEAKAIEKMQQDEIIRMAMQAGMDFKGGFGLVIECVTLPELERFAALVAAKLFTYEQVKVHIQAAVLSEREACAKVCKETQWSNWFQSDCIAAIRARGDE